MTKAGMWKSVLAGSACVAALSTGAYAAQFDIPGGDLNGALSAFSAQTGVQLVMSYDAVKGARSRGAHGDLTAEEALTRILDKTGFAMQRRPSGAVAIVPAPAKQSDAAPVRVLADAAPARAATGVETVVVTSSKIKGDIQTVPIAITALSQEQLTSRQIAGGPDLVKEVPNLTFTKTNFSGYSIAIRGIGTQAISVSTDPAVAVALNDIPFIRNHFFEQEFYDVNQVEVIRGPQGTLYGRNATAGVVNVITAKPTDQFEAMLSADWGNYSNRRYEGMVNIPIVDDRLDLRVAGEWTKRDGYTTNEITGSQVDGRDLWSTRVTLQWKPSSNVQADLVWEHFSEDDDRMRTSKQLCYSDNPTNHPGIANVLGVPVLVPGSPGPASSPLGAAFTLTTGYLSQGCLPASLYSPKSFEVPYGYSLPVVVAGWASLFEKVTDPYASTTQSTNLRDIQTEIDPRYIAKNDTLELNVDYAITPALTFTSQTGYNNDFLWSTEDYNRFDTAPGIFIPSSQVPGIASDQRKLSLVDDNGVFCDPQLGCSSRLVAQDISSEHAWQLSQEFRLASNFKGPFNFSVGGNYMHYETAEQYYVFANTLTLFAASQSLPIGKTGLGFGTLGAWDPSTSDNHECFQGGGHSLGLGYGYQYNRPSLGAGVPTEVCYYIDPNPLTQVNAKGHNYFLSQNPYKLDSYAAFGETYYDVFSDLKLTGGIRWTDDKKHFIDIPSELLANGYGYQPIATVDQQWNQLTGRMAANWTPKLDFTDQTLVYGSFAHGYKAGGANPPGATLFSYGSPQQSGVPVHPLTFKPEFIDAYELGTKNTLLDGGLTLNGDIFFYNYKGYQISEIVDRTAINLNFDATVRGAELEASYEPIPGLKFNFAGGYEATRINDGQSSVDLMDRTAGHPGWMLLKPFVTLPSNCVLPDYVVAALLLSGSPGAQGNPAVSACGTAYTDHFDPVPNFAQGGYYHWNNGNPYYTISPSIFHPFDPGTPKYFYPFTSFTTSGYPGGGYPGFDPLAGTPGDTYEGQNTFNGFDYGPVPNNGEGFAKNVGGNQLPNAPHFTVSFSGDYTIPVSEDWAATLHSDFYWQSQSFARVFNDRPYDKLRGYSNVNLALILTNASGWQVMGYLKNVFDTTAITGAFLNSDDSGLTTNVFLTDPRLFGVRVTKNW
jgi:iron complex outermembrane receptor protein